MPKIEFSALVNTIKGKLSGTVLSSTKGITYLKRHNTNPVYHRSQKQKDIRGIISDLAGEFYSLPQVKKDLWAAFASMLPKPMSALNAFTSLNQPLLYYLGQPAKITSPPPTPSTPEHPQTLSVHTLAAADFRIYWQHPTDADTYIIVNYRPVLGIERTTSQQWKHGTCVLSTSAYAQVNTDLDPNRPVKFRIKTMDTYGRQSPWSHIIQANSSLLYIYVADSTNHRIVKRLKSDLSYISQIGEEGSGDDQFNLPYSVTVDDRYIFVPDTMNHRIVKRLKSDLSYISQVGEYGWGDNDFDSPCDVIPDDTYIYVADTNNCRIVKRLKSDLTYVSQVGEYGFGDNDFFFPLGITVDDTHIYVADTYSHRIVKRLKSDLTYVSQVGEYGSDNDQFNYPSGITVDETYIYVADTYNCRIIKRLKSDLSYVSQVGEYGLGDNQFYYPDKATVDDTHIYVADTYNNRIFKRLKSDLTYVSKIGEYGSGNDQFYIPGNVSAQSQFV